MSISNNTGYLNTNYQCNSNSTISWINTCYNNNPMLTPALKNASIYIKQDLIVGGSINNPSDLKLKENIEKISLDDINNKLMNLVPKEYTYKSDKNKHIHYGLIAQETELYFPNLVSTVDTDELSFKSINYIELIPLLLLKIQDLQSQIDQLNTTL